MRRSLMTLAAMFVALTVAAPAAAQAERVGPVPAPGMVGLGVSLSAALPSDDFLTNGPQLAVSAERYVTRRIAVRGLFAGSWLDVTGHAFTGTVRPVTVTGNAVYNWEGGKLHPYVTGGVGFYRYRFNENALEASANKAGANFGGGLEWFLTRGDTITGEVLFHAVPGPVRSSLTDYDTSFWTLAAGYKKYF